jgi:hypothetical protein
MGFLLYAGLAADCPLVIEWWDVSGAAAALKLDQDAIRDSNLLQNLPPYVTQVGSGEREQEQNQ